MTVPSGALPPRFRLVSYFTLASFVALGLVAALMLYAQHEESRFFKQVQREQNAFFVQMQRDMVRRHDEAAPEYLLRVYEANNTNLTRLIANALWDRHLAPLVAQAQGIPVDDCRATATDASGKSVPPGERQACQARVNRQIRALPGFRTADARLLELVENSALLKVKIYDLRGTTIYSSEHSEIGADKRGQPLMERALTGEPTSKIALREHFSGLHGLVRNRDIIATYVPIVERASDGVVAVIEVYADATQFLNDIKSTLHDIQALTGAAETALEHAAAANRAKVDGGARQQYAMIAALMLLLYGALFFIVRWGQQVLDRHDAQRKSAEVALLRQKDLYDVLSQTNKAIVHLADRDTLFATVCRIAVEHGRFRFAWVGLIDPDDNRLRPVARYGDDNDYIDALDSAGNGTGSARRGLTGRAILSGKHVLCNDFLADPAMAPWHEQARQAGVRASAKFPIHEAGAVVGAISVYAGEVGYFTHDLVATLEEMAGDVSFALDNFVREAARAKAEAALLEGEARYRRLFHANPHPMWVYDLETLRFLEVNDAAISHYGWSREEFLAMTIADIRPPEDVPRLLDNIAGIEDAKVDEAGVWTHRKKDGALIAVEITSHVLDFAGRRAEIVLAHDITLRKQADEAMRAAAEQFRGLVEQSIAGIYIIQDGLFAYVNPRFAEILGYGHADELVGCDPLQVVSEKERSTVAEAMHRQIDDQVPGIAYSFTALRKDGSTAEIGAHGACASYRGRPAIIGLMQDISEKKRAEAQIQQYVAQLESAFMHTVEVATTLSEMRDPYTAGHERRVGELSVAIGTELGLDARRVEGLRVAGYLHDLGKISVPTEILAKPGKLSAAEFALIKGHAQAGHDILKNVAFPWPVAEIALQHHERLDGSGYPEGLKGEAILLEARIMAVADVVEAMSSHRPYRPGLGIDKALAEIERGRGTAYDPDVADACLRLFREKGYAMPA